MRIIGIENMSPEQLKGEVAAGGRFVIYQYCISVVVVDFYNRLVLGRQIGQQLSPGDER